MSESLIGVFCIALMLLLLVIRTPVALSMGLAGTVGLIWIIGFEPSIYVVENAVIAPLSNYNYSPIVLFILMGAIAGQAHMSQNLFQGARIFFGGWRGGMSFAAISSCGIFSAISGSSVATAASMSKAALPEMEKNGYSPYLSAGTLAAGGTLGIMIPPSIALLLYGLITEQSVGKMFLAGIIPGILGMLLYLLVVMITLLIFPSWAKPSEKTTIWQKLKGLAMVLPFLSIFALIIGGIYLGYFTPTQSASVGTFLMLILAIYKGMKWKGFISALKETLAISTMIFLMIIGAEIFGHFLIISQLPQDMVTYVNGLNLSPYWLLFYVLLLFILLGMIMDSMAMLLLVVPIVYPIMMAAGFDPIWFGIVAVITVELGLITPPVGMNIFVIKSVAPHLTLGHIYKGVAPFILADFIRLFLIILFPALALFLAA